MTWTRIIINTSIFMILANVSYKLLMQLLGVTTAELGNALKEKKTLEDSAEKNQRGQNK